MMKGVSSDKFKKGLKDVIDSFEKAKEWADLSNCLQKVKKQFDTNPGAEIPMKKDLAKRLAQCLNPDLAVIHQLTLEVYGMIFQRQIELMKDNKGQVQANGTLEWGSDLGLFYSGLFNFYQFAAFEVKEPFLTIIESYVLQLDKELLLSLPGFMICMLPALEDQNAQILKRVEGILAKTEEAVGTSEFYGEIWKAMLRTTRTRLSAIKYLEKRIPKDLEVARQMAKLGQIYTSKYQVQIADQKVVLTMDHVKTTNEIKRLENMTLDNYFYFYYPLKEKLCINSLLAGLSDNSVYVNRGVLDFLISHAPITGNVNSLTENVRLVEGALYTLNKRDFAFLKKFFTWVLGHLDDEESRPNEEDPAIKTLVPALQCMFNKFMDKNEIMKLIQKEKGQHQNPQNIPILILQTLLNDNSMIIEPILVKISVDLIKYIKMYYSENKKDPKQRFHENVSNLFDMVQNQLSSIWMALGQLLSEQIREISLEIVQDAYQLEAIELIDFCLKQLKIGFEKQNENQFSEQLRPILSRLFSGVKKLSNYMNNLENAIPALELIENILFMLDKKPVTQEDTEHLKVSIDNFNNFYVDICKVMTAFEESDYIEMFKLRFDTFKKASQILNQIQKYSNTYELNTMPEWLKMVIECSKTKRAKIALVSIETFLNILSKQCSPDDPVKKLQNLIVCYDKNIKLEENRNIYQTLQNTKNPYCTDIIKTLWSLLVEEEDHQKIVTLLKKFDGLLPKIFSEVVTDELNSKDREVKDRAIKKFTIFWKLTANDYPQYKPFYEKDTDLRRYVALHNILHILEDKDPTLRLSCKSWLSESKQFYRRILDPLIEEFLSNSKVFVTYSGQIFFYEHYETQIVIQNFGKLRNIILNTQEEMILYMMSRQSTDYIQKQFDELFYWMRPRRRDLKCQNKYLQIIVYITLQFIMGQAVESVNDQLYQESQTVNASACEFMELILKSLEQHKETSNEIAHIIIDPILRTFRQVIDNQNHAMQVHLLNLLKVIFFQCNFDSLESKQDCERILKDPFFIDSIVKGMKNEVSFVRYHFIQFATTIMPMMNALIKPQDFTVHIKKFIDCFCQLLKHVDVTLFQTQAQLLAATAVNLDGQVDRGLMQISRTLKQTMVNKQNTHYLTNKKHLDYQVINQESDIAQIISGLDSILCFCLGIVKESGGISQNSGTTIMTQDNSTDSTMDTSYRQVEQSFGDKIKGFFSAGPFKKGEYIVVNEKLEIREAIYLEFQNIIVSCLNCWNDLPIYTGKDYLFSRSGVFPYTSEDEKLIGTIIERSAEKAKEQYYQGDNYRPQDRMSIRDPVNLYAFTLKEYIHFKTNQVQRYVIDFLRPLAETSSNHFIEGILLVWMNKKNFTGMNIHKSLEKIMQMLQSVRLKPYVVIESINKFIDRRQLMTKKASSNKRTELKKIDCQRETMMCQFLYTYLLYNISHQFKTEDHNSAKIYAAIVKFVKFYQNSKHPATICWLLEILHILSIKFSPADAYKNDGKLKKEYHEILTNLLQSTAAILSDTNKIEFDKTYGFKMVFPPTVYELLRRFSAILEHNQYMISQPMAARNDGMRKHVSSKHNQGDILSEEEDFDEDEEAKNDKDYNKNLGFGRKGRLIMGFQNQNTISVDHLLSDQDYVNINYYFDEKDNISQLMTDLSEWINKDDQDCPGYLLNKYFKYFTIITMKSILYPMVQSIVGHTNHDKITNALSIIVNVVLQILNKREEKDKQQIVIIETITDFFAALMDKANQLLVKPYKREISELFYSDDFFRMSRRTLRKWCKIINHFISDQKDAVFEDLLYKWNTQAGLLTTKDYEIKQKCIALKRVSFLVFSGDMDQYDDKLDLLLKKMTEGFKTNKKYKDLRIELFLLTRVLLLRLSTNTLTDALRKLWPHLLNELVSIFEDPQPDIQLTFEAIKMIELMSSLNIEDFQMNQWIFLVDAYGMKFQKEQEEKKSQVQPPKNNQPKKKMGDYEAVLVDKDDAKKDGLFQPFIVKFMQNTTTSFYNQDKTMELPVQDLIKGKKHQMELRKTSIYIDPQFIDEASLEIFAFELQYKLNELNTERTEIDRQNFEALIEKDFIEPEHKNQQ